MTTVFAGMAMASAIPACPSITCKDRLYKKSLSRRRFSGWPIIFN
jgi:hypothetical protein